LFSVFGWGQVNITPTRTDVSGFASWIDTDISGSTYVQLLQATSSTISPVMDFNSYTGESLNFKARTFGGTTAAEIILTVWISTDNGGNWTNLGTRTPLSSTLVAQAPFDLSSYSGTQVKIKFTVAGTSNAIGVGIDEISISGFSTTTPSITVTPSSRTGFTYVSGSGPSAEQSLTVSGSNLTTNLVVTPSTNYEISSTTGSGFGSSVSLTPTTGTVPNTTIYVRLKAGLAVANYNSENIAATSTGATTKNVACSGSVTAAASGCNELFISEYGEGSSNNKYIEIYNPTASTITLTGNYDLAVYANGSATATSTIALTGTIAAYGTFVLNNATAITADQISGSLTFNGDDAVALRKASVLIDVIGLIGTDPGAEWGTGLTSTATNTLIRKSTIQNGDSNGSDTFDPATEWNGYAVDTWTYVGTHESICDPNPIITVSPTSLTGFTFILATGPSAEQTFTASGSKLTANMVITPPTDFEISTTSGSGFGSSITLTPTSGTVAATTIYVRLKAGLAVASYNSENITATSAAATTKNISCSGTVTQPTITSATTALSGFTYTVGTGPSANQNFTVSGSNLSANLVVIAPTNYEIATSSGGVYGTTLSYTPSLGIVSSQIIYIRLKSGLAINSYNESISITSTNAATKTITLSGAVTGNLESDIITANGESATVSSLENDATITTTADGTQVWQFTIRDGGSDLTDADNLQTIVNSIVFSQNLGNAIDVWSDAIQAVALFNGTTKIADGVVSTNQITFTGDPLISVPDNGSVTLTVRLSVQINPNNTGGNLDGDDFVFNISNANVTTSASGSGFSSFTAANSINGQNVLSVVASKLVFTQQPTSTGIGSPMTTVKVSATDANGNIDLGYSGIVSITSTGTMTSSPRIASAVAGVSSFTSIIHSVVGTGLTLEATATGLTLAMSTPFDINTSTVFKPGELLFVGYDGQVSGSGANDEYLIATLVDIAPGTSFTIVNARYEAGAAANVRTDKWGGGGDNPAEAPYTAVITYKSTNTSSIPAGSVLAFTTDGSANWFSAVNVVTGTTSNNRTTDFSGVTDNTFSPNISVTGSDSDQIYLLQGSFTSDGTIDANQANYTLNGTLLHGLTNAVAWVPLTSACSGSDAGGITRESRLPITLTCFSVENTVSNAQSGFYKNNQVHGTSVSPVTKRAIIQSVSISGNWTFSSGRYTKDPSSLIATRAEATYYIGTSNSPGQWVGNVDTNWFNCANWEGLVVPDVTTDVTVDSNSSKNSTISYLATYSENYQDLAVCNNLTISTKQVILEASTNNKLEVHGNVIINSTGTLDMDDNNDSNADGQMYLYGNWTNNLNSLPTTNFLEGNGTVHFLGSTTQVINNNVHSNPEEFANVVLGNDFDTSISNNLIANGDLTVNAGKIVTVSPSDYLKVQNGLKNNGTVNILSDDYSQTGSLVQINDTNTNIGDIKFERTSTVILNTDYTYWSSPVLDQTLLQVSPNTFLDKFYVYNASIEDWENVTDPVTYKMVAGKGYIFLGPKTYTAPSLFKATFIGKPNNGKIEIPIVFNLGAPEGTSNLIGNPYPSAIDADKFLDFNKTVIDGTIYFWTHNTKRQNRDNFNITDPVTGEIIGTTAGSGTLAYTSDDYASYNLLGGVGTSMAPSGSTGGVNANIPNGKIAAGQAFFTTSKLVSGNAIFNNSMRIDNLGKIMDNSQFFKTRNPKTKTTTFEKHRIWLNLTNTQGAFKQTLIGYITDATNEYDSRFDGESFDGNEFVDFYSINQEKNLVIQGRALPFDENDQVPLGFRTTIEGAFTIKIDQADGVLTNQAVFIEDKLTNSIFDLRSGPFTFNTVAGTFNDRFVLRYTNKTLGTIDLETFENQVLVSNKNKQIKINSKAVTIDKVVVYDLLGRLLFKKDKVNSNEFSVLNLISNSETLLVKVTLQNGETVTRKILY